MRVHSPGPFLPSDLATGRRPSPGVRPERMHVLERRMAQSDFVELASVIRALREQLLDAQQERLRDEPSFAVGKVQVELSVEVKVASGGGAGLRFGVASADAKAERARGSVHKVTLELIPTRTNGRDFIIAAGATEPTPE